MALVIYNSVDIFCTEKMLLPTGTYWSNFMWTSKCSLTFSFRMILLFLFSLNPRIQVANEFFSLGQRKLIPMKINEIILVNRICIIVHVVIMVTKKRKPFTWTTTCEFKALKHLRCYVTLTTIQIYSFYRNDITLYGHRNKYNHSVTVQITNEI